jgi:hypothetical protein
MAETFWSSPSQGKSKMSSMANRGQSWRSIRCHRPANSIGIVNHFTRRCQTESDAMSELRVIDGRPIHP